MAPSVSEERLLERKPQVPVGRSVGRSVGQFGEKYQQGGKGRASRHQQSLLWKFHGIPESSRNFVMSLVS